MNRKTIRGRSLSLILLSIAVVLGLSSCGEDVPSQQQTGEPVQVQTATAQVGDWPDQYQFTGTVQGRHQATLSTKVMGQIETLNVEEGDKVKKGQLLVSIQRKNLLAQQNQVEARLWEARTALQNAETQFNRIKNLHESESATQQEFDNAQTQYEMAKAKVKALESKKAELDDMLDYTKLQAPMDGYVVKKMAQEGDMASPGRPLLTIEQLGNLKVIARVPESRIGLFRVDDPVEVHIRAATDQPVEGTVTNINPGGDPVSRNFQVEVRLPEEKVNTLNLKSGMYAEVQLSQGDQSRLAVLDKALVKRGQLQGLYTISQDQKAVLRWVRTGKERNGRVEILSGLKEGETYIVDYPGSLREGLPVEVQ